ncbi:uncharacterized protein LOC144101193 isoform X2 [Amblyomma americanum]
MQRPSPNGGRRNVRQDGGARGSGIACSRCRSPSTTLSEATQRHNLRLDPAGQPDRIERQLRAPRPGVLQACRNPGRSARKLRAPTRQSTPPSARLL